MKATERAPYGPRGQGGLLKREGSENWYSYLFVHGKEVIESTETSDLKDAKKFHKQRLDELALDRQGKQTFVGPALKRLRVSAFLDALETEYRLRGVKSYPKVLSHFKPVRAHFGPWRAVTVTEQAVDVYIEQRRRDGKSDPTINRETQILGQALRMKVDGVQLPAPPTIRHLKEDNVRRDFFEGAEFDTVVAALPAYLQDFTRFAHACGWRKGEVTSLRWRDVDREAREIRLPDSKNGEGRTLGLDDDLHAVIERRWQARVIERPDGTTTIAEYVFHRGGRPIGDCRKAWATACITAGLFKLVQGAAGTETRKPTKLFHGLRRTGVRDMIRSGVPEHIAMRISGHKTRSMLDRYNIVNTADTRDAMARTAQYRKARGEAAPTVTAFPKRSKRKIAHG